MHMTKTSSFHSSSRRSLLRTLAVGAGAIPMLNPLGRSFLSKAHASSTGAPRRVIFYTNPNGLPSLRESATWYSAPGSTPTTFTLGSSLKPLEKYRDQLVVLQNLEMKGLADFKGGTGAHQNGVIMSLTGSQENENMGRYWGASRNASIDWRIAQEIGTKVTPGWPMIGMGIQASDATPTWKNDGNRVSHNNNPYDLYAKIFGTLTGGTGAVDPALMKRLAMRKSVLDGVAKQLGQFSKGLGAEDRARCEAQTEVIRRLEKRLVTTPDGGGACTKPGPIPVGLEWRFQQSQNVPELCEVFSDMTVAAMACDLTRVATIVNYDFENHDTTCNFAPVNRPKLGPHSLSHDDGGSFTDGSYLAFKTFLIQKLVRLCDKLSQIPEAGGTMLDNTVIYVFGETHLGHGYDSMQVLTVGGKNLGIRTGQSLQMGKTGVGNGTDHNRLLVSLLQCMGIPADAHGVLDSGKGTISSYMA